MKKIAMICLMAAVMISLVACSSSKDTTSGSAAPDSGSQSESASQTVSPSKPTITGYEAYDELIALMEEGFACNFDDERFETIEIPDAYYLETGFKLELPGYMTEDLDGNGTEELIFGASGEEETKVYAVFTMKNGELIRPVNGWVRNRFYLCEDGTIANEGSSGAASSSYSYYSYSDGAMSLIEEVIFDGWADPDHPWFYNTDETLTSEDIAKAEQITEEQALAIIEKYHYRKLELQPFAEALGKISEVS